MAPFGKIYSYPVSTTSFLPGGKTKGAVVPHHSLFLFFLRLKKDRHPCPSDSVPSYINTISRDC